MIAQCLYQSDPKNLASMVRQRLACQRAARKYHAQRRHQLAHADTG